MSNLIDRRTLIQAAGASVVAGSVKVAQAAPTTGQSGGATDDLIVRKIPKGEDVLPAIGLGTFITFDLVPGARRDHLLEVTHRFWAAGGRVIDTSPLYGMAEVNVGQFASMLGINDKMFVSNKVWATGEYLADERQAEDSLRLSRERLWRDKIDLMLCHSLVNVDIILGRRRSASSPPRPTMAQRSRSTCRSRRRGCTSSSKAVLCLTSPRSLGPRPGRPSS
jgi:hypothetical protein